MLHIIVYFTVIYLLKVTSHRGFIKKNSGASSYINIKVICKNITEDFLLCQKYKIFLMIVVFYLFHFAR